MSNIPISKEGFDKIKKELAQLKKERPEVIQAIKEAREEGDLKENGGYHAARERQGMLEAKINYIESRIPQFNVVDMATLGGSKVTFGATVELEDIETGEEKNTRSWDLTKVTSKKALSQLNLRWVKLSLVKRKAMKSSSTLPAEKLNMALCQ